MEKSLPSLEALQEEAAAFASGLSPQESGATLVTLTGELGAGKTSFTQGLARALGVTEHVTSPTFVLEKVYDLKDQAYDRLVHIDAYRLDGGQALAPLNFGALSQDPKNLIVIEWPERVAAALPAANHAIALRVSDEGGRIISYA